MRGYGAADGFRQFCVNTSRLQRTLFFLHHHKLIKTAGVDLVTHDMVDRYLRSLYLDPSHPPPWTNLGQLDVVRAKTSVSVRGFKLMYGTLERHTALCEWIDQHSDVCILHLVRNNLLKSFVSIQRMRLTKVAHTTDPSFPNQSVSIEINKLFTYFESISSKRRSYRKKYSGSHPYLELSYEEMFADNTVTIRNLLAFFSLETEPMPLPDVKKTGTAELRNEITNYQEVIDALTGTQYEAFLQGCDGLR